MPEARYVVEVERRYRTGTDRYGEPEYGYRPVEQIRVYGIAPAEHLTPSTAHRDEVEYEYDLFAPTSVVLDRGDKVSWQGISFVIHDPTERWDTTPEGFSLVGVVAHLRRIEG